MRGKRGRGEEGEREGREEKRGGGEGGDDRAENTSTRKNPARTATGECMYIHVYTVLQ